MSQSHGTTDTHDLLQSMLQRLKLQPGTESQGCSPQPSPTTAALDGGQNGGSGLPNFQTAGRVNNITVNGFGAAVMGSSQTDDITREPKEEGKGDLGFGLISSPSHKDNVDCDRGEKRSVTTPTGKGQLLPGKTHKDADVPTLKRTDDNKQGEREDNAVKNYIPSKNFKMKDAVTNHHDDRGVLPDTSPLTSRTLGQGQDQDSSLGFTPRIYTWSLKTTEASPGTSSQEKEALNMGNGGPGTEVFTASQTTTNSTSGKTQRKQLPATKTKRWTQKIKERWREKNGSLGKKRKDAGERVERNNDVEPPAADDALNTSNEGERTQHDAVDASPAPSDCTTGGHTRSTSDFELGLGSFSLLEEILTGQEWAKFLNPTLSGISTNQGSSEQPTSQLQTTLNAQDQGDDQSPVIPNNQWNFRGHESDLGMAPISTDASIPVSMDISEANRMPEPDAEREAIQSDPVEHGVIQSYMESEDSDMGLKHTAHQDRSSLKPADILNNAALMSRVHLNRKRSHQSPPKKGETLQAEEGKTRDREEAERDESRTSPSPAPSHAMDQREELKDDNAIISLYTLKSSLAPSPTSPVPAPRGVLKHSMSQDSCYSITMETVAKKRRVEGMRHVRFSEEVVTIAPIDLDLGGTEEDSGSEEEDSVIEDEEVEMEQAAREEDVVPVARLAFPAWILALKRRNTRRKHR